MHGISKSGSKSSANDKNDVVNGVDPWKVNVSIGLICNSGLPEYTHYDSQSTRGFKTYFLLKICSYF